MMREIIEAVIFSDESSYEIHSHTGVNQGVINDLKDGCRSIDYICYIDAERIYHYGLQKMPVKS